MTAALVAALGGAVGGLGGVMWLGQTASKWRRIWRLCIFCALLGGAITVAAATTTGRPHGTVAVFLAYGLFVTLGAPVWLLLPLPRLKTMDDVHKLIRRAVSTLAVATFYGLVAAVLGSLAMEAVMHVVMKAFLG
jgi:hypothetical protein